MKKVIYNIVWNRFSAIFLAWFLVLGWVFCFSTNKYANVILITFGLIAVVLACAVVIESEKHTEGEKVFLNKF